MPNPNWKEIAEVAIRDHRAIQRGDELAGYLEWLSEQDVHHILEVGVERGGLMWAHAQVLPKAYLTGLDIEVRQEAIDIADAINKDSDEPSRAAIICGDSMQQETEDRVSRYCVGLGEVVPEIDLVFIDGKHDFPWVVNDFIRYGLKASRWVVFHDIKTTRWGAKVNVFWNEVLPHFGQFGTKGPEWLGRSTEYGIGAWRVNRSG